MSACVASSRAGVSLFLDLIAANGCTSSAACTAVAAAAAAPFIVAPRSALMPVAKADAAATIIGLAGSSSEVRLQMAFDI